MSAWTIYLDNLLEEIKYAAHAGDMDKAKALADDLKDLLQEAQS